MLTLPKGHTSITFHNKLLNVNWLSFKLPWLCIYNECKI